VHLLAPSDEVVLIPGVALKFVTPEVNQNHCSCFGTIIYDLYRVGAPLLKTKQTLVGLVDFLSH
jgi:hypothetical protein